MLSTVPQWEIWLQQWLLFLLSVMKHQLLVKELTLEKQQESYEIDRLELLDLLGDFRQSEI